VKAAILAAGLGERLLAAGYEQPKPLVPVAGRALIDYVLAAVSDCGLREVACIVNEQSRGIETHCRDHWPDLSFEFIRRTTPNSMESLFTLAPRLDGGRFLLLTVDSIFAPSTLAAFLETASTFDDAQGVLALTSFVEDEKPLWVELDPAGRVATIGPAAAGSSWVTAGFYRFDAAIFAEIAVARRAGFTALRQFLGHLVASGYPIYGAAVGKCVDVDRAEDLASATAFVHSGFTS